MVAAMGTGIGKVIDAVETSNKWWILAAATTTLDSTLTARSEAMDSAAVVGTSSRRANDAVGNATDAVGTSSSRWVKSGMICIFSKYRHRINFFVNIIQL
jgi:hypothetical protein